MKFGFVVTSVMCFMFLLSGCQTNSSSSQEAKKKESVANINVRLGMAYLERHDIQRAKQKFLLALEEAPEIPETWYSMGYFMESTGNKEHAKQYYEKSISLAPKRGDVLNNYGTYLCHTGVYQASVTYFLKATQDPTYLQVAAAYENAGLCALKIPDNKSAMSYFKKALQEDPQRANSLIELAELNFQQGQYQSSRKELSQYLQLTTPTAQSYLLEKKLDAKMGVES